MALLVSFTLAACGGPSATPVPPSAGNLNLVFVVSEDLAYHASGDVDPNTANLTNQGLQRSLLMATFLKQQVLGTKNVTAIYALEPMTHLQTAHNYPDMTALVTIQQFALLNQITMSGDMAGPCTANSYPINASYATGSVPGGVAAPLFPSTGCQVSISRTRGAATKPCYQVSSRPTSRAFMYSRRLGRPSAACWQISIGSRALTWLTVSAALTALT